MAGRFQRLDDSIDISVSPETSYTSKFYDEPQNIYSNNEAQSMFSEEDRRRMSYTTRKPVPQTSRSQSTTPEQPLIRGYFDTTPPVGGPENPYGYSKRKSKTSVISRVSSAWSQARGHHVSQVSTPLFAAPWRHQVCNDLGSARASTVRYFDRKKQQNRIFFHFFLQWLIPVAFCAALVAVLYIYSSKSKVSRREKYYFNAFVMGFSLCLGFSVVNGMKEYANILRWRLLAGRFHSLQQFELLLGLASQKKALRLLWVGRTEGSILPNGVQILCFFYLLLMIGLQVGIALLGLCYSVDTTLEEINLTMGNVSIAKLDFIQQADVNLTGIDPFLLQSGAINNYGITAQRYGVNYTNTFPATPEVDSVLPLMTDNSTKWWYHFVDLCPSQGCTTSYITSRYVVANATCVEYTIVEGGFKDSTNVTVIDQYGQERYSAYLNSETSGTTTWYADTQESCGDRCTTIYALNVGLQDTDTNEVIWRPQFFQCNNSISQVAETEGLSDSDAYKLPDEQARLVAGAIGYNGASHEGDDIVFQGHTYDAASLWSWTRMMGTPMSAKDMGNLAMRFSIGAVASLDNVGPRKYVMGLTPLAAQQVSVLWRWAIIVLITVPGVQFCILVLTVILGNRAVVRDDSFLSSATLLRPIVERLERSGCALTSDEICEVLNNPSIAYGVRMPHGNLAYGAMAKGNDEVLHLDVIHEEENNNKASDLGWRVGMTMPQGRYDGTVKEENTAVTTGRSEGQVRKRRKSF